MKKSIAILLALVLSFNIFPVVNAENENYAYNAFVDVKFYDVNEAGIVGDAHTVKNMTDNNTYSVYSSPTGTQRAVYTLDMYERQYINRVYLLELYTSVLEFNLSVSNDKINWTKVYSGKRIGAYGKNIHFNTTRARYVKLDVTKTDNAYKDAIVTFSEWQVYNDASIIRNDLNNAVYLAEKKAKTIVSDGVKHHFTDEEISLLNEEIQGAKEVLADAQATQAVIDKQRDSLELMISNYDEKMEPTKEDYEYLRAKYNTGFTNNHLEKTESRLKSINNQYLDSKSIRESMIRTSTSKELWADLIPPRANTQQESGKLGDAFTRIRKLAVAYCQTGNPFYQDEELLSDIKYALDFMITKKYNPTIEEYSNWYPWEVSAPAAIADILLLLKDDLSKELIQRIREAVEFYVDQDFHYTWVGANRLYLSAASLKMGVALEDPFYIHRTRYALAQESKYTDKQIIGSSENNGYFWDGSYIFHSGYMYNATYGRDQLTNTSNIIGMLVNTVWQIEQSTIDDLAKRIVDGYESIIYNGNTVDVAGGRGFGSGESFGKTIASNIESISEYLDEPYKTNFKSIAKQMKLDQGLNDSLTKNKDVIARGDITKLKRYPIGDKLIYHSPDFGFGLSMFSKRTRTFEATNGDAMKAWYASSGMTYFLNNDRTQYDRNFWITVDHYRLPGTTVDRVLRSTTRFEGEMYNTKDWVSSIDYDEKYGAAGMEVINWNSTMQGKKSWFLFGDEIVSIGSDISGGSATVETTVENRKLTSKNNKTTVNGSEIQEGNAVKVNKATTAHFTGDGDEGEIGYYFIDQPELNVVRESRTQKEADMWLSDSTAEYTADYFTMWYDHGLQPKKASYAYVTLMGYSQEDTQVYAKNPNIEVIAQNSDVHAVRHKKLGVTGYNFWSKKSATAGGVSSDGRVNMIVREDNKQIEINLTDPTFTATKPVTLTFDTKVTKVLSNDERVKVLSTSPLKIEVDLKNINGKNIVLNAAKVETNLTDSMVSNLREAVVMSTDTNSYISGNIIKEQVSGAVLENDAIFLPMKTIAEELGSRYSYSKDIDTYQVIDNTILRIKGDGSVTINGEERVFDYTAAIVKDDVLYVSLKLIEQHYNTATFYKDGIAIVGSNLPIKDSDPEGYAKSITKWLSAK